MFQRLRLFLEMIRFSHTLFALPFALTSMVLAWQTTSIRWLDIVGVLLCMVFARSAAMAFNRIVDRTLDAANPRTASRHLPSGSLSVSSVVLFTSISVIGFVASTWLFTFQDEPNYWPVILSGPVIVWLLLYSLTKRFTSLAHFWLGASLMLAPIAAWIAIRGMVQMETPILLGVAVFFWVSGFDILYACQDAEFDSKAGLHSIPARFGIAQSLRLALLCHVMMLVALLGLGLVSEHLGTLYFVGLSLIAMLLIYEHWLVRPDDLTRVNRAFFQVNGVISVGLLLLVIGQVLIA